MNRLIRTEWLKLATTRGPWLVIAGVMALTALITPFAMADIGQGDASRAADAREALAIGPGFLSALMLLIPDARTGFFIVNQRENSKLRDDVKWAILEKFFPLAKRPRPVPLLPAPETVHAEQYAGRYVPLWSCFSCQPIRAPSVMTLTANADGTLFFAGGLGIRWLGVPGVWRAVRGRAARMIESTWPRFSWRAATFGRRPGHA